MDEILTWILITGVISSHTLSYRSQCRAHGYYNRTAVNISLCCYLENNCSEKIRWLEDDISIKFIKRNKTDSKFSCCVNNSCFEFPVSQLSMQPVKYDKIKIVEGSTEKHSCLFLFSEQNNKKNINLENELASGQMNRENSTSNNVIERETSDIPSRWIIKIVLSLFVLITLVFGISYKFT